MIRRLLKDVDWSLADGLWAELSNREIAQRLGTNYSKVTLQRAKRIQQALASGRSATPFERVRPERVCYDWSLADGLWQDLTNRELAQRLGIHLRQVVRGRRMLIQQALASGQPTTPFVRRKAKTYDWSPADGLWAELSNRKLAKRLKIPPKRVDRERRTRIAQALASGQSAAPFRRYQLIDWSKAHGLWTELNSHQIAQRLGATHKQVSNYRAKRIREARASGQPATPFQWVRPKREAADWSKVDGLWTTMRNSELSRMLGVRYGLVAIARHARIVRAKREGKSAEPYIYQR